MVERENRHEAPHWEPLPEATIWHYRLVMRKCASEKWLRKFTISGLKIGGWLPYLIPPMPKTSQEARRAVLDIWTRETIYPVWKTQPYAPFSGAPLGALNKKLVSGLLSNGLTHPPPSPAR